MPNSVTLPLWVSYVQALAIPGFTVVGAFVAVWIAWQQKGIARQKLDHDRFFREHDRRVAVYIATRTILRDVYREGLSEESVRTYTLCVLDAQFLFDDRVYQYLKKLRDQLARLERIEENLKGLGKGDERDELERMRDTTLGWIGQQGDDRTGFHMQLIPYLKYGQVPPSRLLGPSV